MSQLLTILGIITSLVDVYNQIKATWEKTLTPADKVALAAAEDALFAGPAWKLSGLKLK